MTNIRTEMVRREIVRSLSEMVPERVGTNPAFDDGQNLLEFVDSFQFVCLVMEIEKSLGIQLDLRKVDLATIVQIDALASFVSTESDNVEATL